MKNIVFLFGLVIFFYSLVLSADDKKFTSITSLDIENISGDVEIMPSSGSELIISTDDLNRFNFSQRGSNLLVSQELSKSTINSYHGGGVSIITSGSGNVSNVTIGGENFSSNTEKPAKIAIKIPANKMPIYIKNAAGNWQIGELDSSLSISLNTADVKISKVSELDISITGSGSVMLDKNTDKASVKIMGTGDFKANSDIGKLDALIHGTGDIEVNGMVDYAKIDLAGVGDIKINRLLHKPDVTSHGVGNIEITNKEY